MAKAKKLPSGNWRVQVYSFTDTEGKRHYRSITATTKKQAEYEAAQYALNRQKDIIYSDLTLSEAYARYIDSKSNVLSPSTVREYTQAMHRDFQHLMPIKLSKLTAEIIQTATNEAAAKYAPKTVRNKHGLLHSVLKAYRPDLVLTTHLPQKKRPEYTIPTTSEIQLLLDNANDRIKVPILLASSGGLRRSEICALTPNDFNDFGVTINKAMVKNKDGKFVIKQPKTSAGYRFVPLPKNVIKEALNWELFGEKPYTIQKHFSILVKKLNIPHTTFHKLRHYFASELHAQGIPDKYIAQIGGWESVEILHQIYQHTLRDKETEISNKIINIFANNFSSKNDIIISKKTIV